jgi:glutamine amidotransferase
MDYQLGNLFSVQQACQHLGHNAKISSDPADIKHADYVILPGVGAFRDAMKNLERLGAADAIREHINTGKPFMGVCLGLQLLLTESEEFGTTKGLNIIPGKVKKFNPAEINGYAHKVPQIQWNRISESVEGGWRQSPLRACKQGDFMYFVHSFFAEPQSAKYILSETTYANTRYCSSILKDNVFATQFHPEKSSLYGLNIYKEWFDISKKQS